MGSRCVDLVRIKKQVCRPREDKQAGVQVRGKGVAGDGLWVLEQRCVSMVRSGADGDGFCLQANVREWKTNV